MNERSDRDITIERLGADRLQIIPLLLPRPPAGVFEPDAVGDLVLVPRHVAPTRPDVLLGPVVGQVVDTYRRQAILDVFNRRGRRRVDREGCLFVSSYLLGYIG